MFDGPQICRLLRNSLKIGMRIAATPMFAMLTCWLFLFSGDFKQLTTKPTRTLQTWINTGNYVPEYKPTL